MRRAALSFILLPFLFAAAASRAAPVVPIPPACAADEAFFRPSGSMDNVRAALAARAPINVLAIGSATTVGEVNGSPGTSFPFRMVETLRKAVPGATFDLTVRGGRGMTAEAMLPLLRSALKERHYTLVVWQTGTVEAVRGARPDTMRSVLQDGIEQVRANGGDIVLVDSQFSRFLRANTDLDPYETVLQQLATLPGVSLFHRFDLMRSWADAGQIDLERVQKTDREATITRLNTCLGGALARFVLSGASD